MSNTQRVGGPCALRGTRAIEHPRALGQGEPQGSSGGVQAQQVSPSQRSPGPARYA